MSRIQPAMSDSGRCFTSYIPSCAYDNILAGKYKARSDAEYRATLQTNALRIQDETRKVSVWQCAYPFMLRTQGTPPPAPGSHFAGGK